MAAMNDRRHSGVIACCVSSDKKPRSDFRRCKKVLLSYSDYFTISRDLVSDFREDFLEMLEPDEMFCRAYTQWIARRSGHERLLADMERSSKIYFNLNYYSDADFAKIDQLFTEALKAEKP